MRGADSLSGKRCFFSDSFINRRITPHFFPNARATGLAKQAIIFRNSQLERIRVSPVSWVYRLVCPKPRAHRVGTAGLFEVYFGWLSEVRTSSGRYLTGIDP